MYINSANPDYWYSLGNIYGKTNDTPKAVEAYNKAVELNPGDYEAWINLSELYYKQNHLSKAIKTINDAYKHNEDVAIINYRLAAYYYLKGEPKLGLKFFRKGTELSFAEHTEFFKICPDASEFDEIKEILNQNNK